MHVDAVSDCLWILAPGVDGARHTARWTLVEKNLLGSPAVKMKLPLGINPPVFGTPSPANGSTGNLLSLTWSIPINDPEGEYVFIGRFSVAMGRLSSGTGATNGTKSLVVVWSCVFNDV